MAVSYVTTNQDKFNKARLSLQRYGIELEQVKLELDEYQSLDGNQIVAHKAQQALAKLKKPVLVSDDSWEIPALNGFPATSMKLCNHFLTADDWLRLMNGVTDRSIILHSYLAFCHDSKPWVHFYSQSAYFLTEPRGTHATAPHLTVIAWKGETQSVAEQISLGTLNTSGSVDFWNELALQIQDSDLF